MRKQIQRRAQKMRCIILILMCIFLAPLQCYKSNHFFAMRRDTNEAICISPRRTAVYPLMFSTFDLDKLQIPQDVGFKYWDLLSDWQLQNDTNMRHTDCDTNVLIAGNRPFNLVARDYLLSAALFLASNISLWMADVKLPRGAGMLFEVDHLNETTKLKDTTLKYCDKNPEVEGATCTIVDYKNGTNHLNDGNHWTEFEIKLKENRTGVDMNELSYGKYKSVVQWTWNNTNISDPFTSENDYAISVKSHQRNAAFFTYGSSAPDLANNKEMKRNYTKRSSGKFFVFVYWNEKKSNYSNEMLEVKNFVSGRVQPATNTTHIDDLTYFQWDHVNAGEYEITLRFDERKPQNINLYPDLNILKTWWSIPKAITKCQFKVSQPTQFTAGPSFTPDPNLKTNWTMEEWEHVCDRLGIGSKDAEVPIKFCDWKGCNFSKCPHLLDESSYLFDF